MTFSILTLFPDMFTSQLKYSIVKRAQEKNLIRLNFVNIRDFAADKYQTVDDRPYGGGVGMILKVDVIDRALQSAKKKSNLKKTISILLDPKGEKFTQKRARKLSLMDHIILVCGHYEGVDHRVTKLVDKTISIGNYILTGGEIPALVIIDSVTRLIPKVLFKKEATQKESFTQHSLEPPQFTRPSEYKDMKVPSVLLSGNHQQISNWRKKHAKKIKDI